MLQVNNIQIAFQSSEGLKPTVHGVTFHIQKGEILGLVGESGSGKTLMSLGILDLLPPNARVTGGEVLLDGTDLLKMPKSALRKLRGNRISMIFQDPMASLDPVFPCGEQIMEAILLHENISRAAAHKRAVELLENEHVRDPERVMRSYPHELSGGQCQRVMIAMAVACRPELIIADEPTTALDVTVQRQVLEILKRLNHEVGAAILLITHDLGVVHEVADRVIVMYNGRLMEEADKQELFARPKSDYTKALLDAMPALGHKRGRLPTIEREASGAVRSVVHAEPRAPRPKPSAEGETPLLEIKNLTKTYWLKDSPVSPVRPMVAVDDVSLAIPRHTTLGLVGESGCGKSTLSRMVMRLADSDSGQIRLDGKDIAGLPEGQLFDVRRNLSMVFQNPYGSLNPRQTVADIVGAPLIVHGRKAECATAVPRLIDAVGLPAASAKKFPHEFSGGQRQRIAIARALALNPSLVICDEAVSALDVSVQAQVLNLLKDLQDEFDLTYLFISHDLSVVEHISDTIAVMQSGKIVETGPADEIFANPRESYTRMLLDAVPRIGIQREPEGARVVKQIRLRPRPLRRTEALHGTGPALRGGDARLLHHVCDAGRSGAAAARRRDQPDAGRDRRHARQARPRSAGADPVLQLAGATRCSSTSASLCSTATR
jgi:peptide/nickel transport system ATP-binding protein